MSRLVLQVFLDLLSSGRHLSDKSDSEAKTEEEQDASDNDDPPCALTLGSLQKPEE
jgi:hypothetical protein